MKKSDAQEKTNSNTKIIAIVTATALLVAGAIVAILLIVNQQINNVPGLHIEYNSWNEGGSSAYHQAVFEVKEGQKYSIGEASPRLDFQITEVNERNIKITTPESWDDSNKNTINLKTDKKDFIITKNNKLVLKSPTMDAGTTYILELK